MNPLSIHPKLSSAGIAGAVTILLLWVLATYAHVNPPADVDAAIDLIVSFIAGYLTPADGGASPAKAAGS